MPHNGEGNGHLPVPIEAPPGLAERWHARLEDLSREIASCECPQQLNTLLHEIKLMQQGCDRFLKEHYDLRLAQSPQPGRLALIVRRHCGLA